MQHHKLANILILIFYTIILNGCGAKVLSYHPTVNPNVLDAMQSIREKILSQPIEVPYFAEVTEEYIKVKGAFDGQSIAGKEAIGYFEFHQITDMVLYHEDDLFMVMLMSGEEELFCYFSHNEADAKQFMDNVHTMLLHHANLNKPAAINHRPILNR